MEGATKKWWVMGADVEFPICIECHPTNELDAPSLRWSEDEAVMLVVALAKVPVRVAKLMLAVATDSNITDGLPSHCEELPMLVEAIKRDECSGCFKELFPEDLSPSDGYKGKYCAGCLAQLAVATPLEDVPEGEKLMMGVKYALRRDDGTAYLLDLNS